MTRNDLLEMIRQEIQSLAFETLKDSAQKKKKARSRTFKPKGLSEEELEYAVFYGGDKPEEDKNGNKLISTTIRESYGSGIPQITSSEIAEFENSFEQMLQEVDGASVVFDTQSNGYSLKMSVGQDGIEAGASGQIKMGREGTLSWAYSLKDGLVINTEDLLVTSGNKRLVEKLYSHYDAWQKDWREKLTIIPGKPGGDPVDKEPEPQEPAAGGEEPIPEA